MVSLAAFAPVVVAFVLAAQSGLAQNADQIEVLNLVNQYRQQRGLSPVCLEQHLINASQAHSQDMANMNNLDHTGSDGSNPGDRVRRAGYNWNYVNENIAVGYQTPTDVMNGWKASPGHNANILSSSVRHMGLGVVNGPCPWGGSSCRWWTQNFANTRDTSIVCLGSGNPTTTTTATSTRTTTTTTTTAPPTPTCTCPPTNPLKRRSISSFSSEDL